MSPEKVIRPCLKYLMRNSQKWEFFFSREHPKNAPNSRESRTLKVVLGDQNPPRCVRSSTSDKSQRGGISARAMAKELFASQQNNLRRKYARSAGSRRPCFSESRPSAPDLDFSEHRHRTPASRVRFWCVRTRKRQPRRRFLPTSCDDGAGRGSL